LRSAHTHLLGRLAKLKAEGYDYPSLILSYTNQWRYDNDPPMPELGRFVAAWNELRLQPPLRLTTATDAVMSMEKEVGARVPVMEGEWTDWWANGDASGPREVAASRAAKRVLTAATSELWGPATPSVRRDVRRLTRDLCLFDEHTWGANSSISQPDSFHTVGQYTEKSLLAYRPLGHAEALLARRARALLHTEGLHIANTSKGTWSGWVVFAAPALREPAESVEEIATGKRVPLEKFSGNRVRFWIDRLAPRASASFRLRSEKADPPAALASPRIVTDASGWPVSALWSGMSRPLFEGEVGNFLAAGFEGATARSAIAKLHGTPDPARRASMRNDLLRMSQATYPRAEESPTPWTLVYRQEIAHPRLARAERRLEIWKQEPRARVTLRFDRLPSTAPELLYAAFEMPREVALPVTSNGGVPFTPYEDQLIGSCRDYYAIDGWARYHTDAGDWLWMTRDAPLISIGGPQPLARRVDPPAERHRIAAMLFDNCWHTNFVADSHGTLEFSFEIVWREQIERPEEWADSLVSDPVVVLNPSGRMAPALERHLYSS
jgi:hypothetical protein